MNQTIRVYFAEVARFANIEINETRYSTQIILIFSKLNFRKCHMVYSYKGLTIGDHVKEVRKPFHQGIVVKIVPDMTIHDHGTIYVWQLNRVEYGIDNCEHYPVLEWEKSLKIINSHP